MAAKKGIVTVEVGDLIKVRATDSGTLKDLPAWAKKMGHEYLGAIEEAGYWKLYARRSK